MSAIKSLFGLFTSVFLLQRVRPACLPGQCNSWTNREVVFDCNTGIRQHNSQTYCCCSQLDQYCEYESDCDGILSPSPPPLSYGRYSVRVLRADNLPDIDPSYWNIFDTIDPSVKLWVYSPGSDVSTVGIRYNETFFCGQTATISNDESPNWNEVISCPDCYPHSWTPVLEVIDDDRPKKGYVRLLNLLDKPRSFKLDRDFADATLYFETSFDIDACSPPSVPPSPRGPPPSPSPPPSPPPLPYTPPLPPNIPPPPRASSHSDSSANLGIIIGAAAGGVVLLGGLVFVCLFCFFMHKRAVRAPAAAEGDRPKEPTMDEPASETAETMPAGMPPQNQSVEVKMRV